MQSLYTSTGIQNFYKTLIDLGNNVVQSFTDIPTILNLPIPALLKFGTTFYNIATLVTQMYSMLRARINVQTKAYEGAITANLELEAAKRRQITQEEYDEKVQAAQAAADKVKQIERGVTDSLNEQATLRQRIQGFFTNKKNIGMVASAVGMAATLGATTMSTDTAGQRAGKSALTGLGGLAQGVGTGLMMGGPAGAIMGVLTALPAAIEAIGIAIETTEEKIERYDKAIQDANNNKLISENELNTLTDYRKKFEDLEKHQHDSNQARQEFLTLNAEIAANYPELINGIDEQGNLIVKLGTAYQQLINKKKNAYDDSFIEYWKKQFEAFSDSDFISSRIGVGINTIANTQLGNTAEKIKEDVTAQAVANGNIIESQRTQLDIIRSLAQESKEIDDEYSISKEGYEQLKAKLMQYINFNSEQLDNALGALENEAGTQVTFSGTQLAKKLDAAMDSYLTLNSQDTLEDWVTEWNLNKSENTQQITSAVTEVKEYEKTLYNNLITSMVSDVRKMYDSIFDPQDTLNELSGSFINNTLIDSAKAAMAGAADPSAAFNNWAKIVLPELYTSLLKNVQDKNSGFSALNEYYQDIGNLTIEQYNKIASKYSKDSKAKEAWDTFEAEFTQVREQADKIFHQAIGRPVYYEYSANTKKRIASLKNKDNINLERFTAVLEGQDEEGINSILNIIESGTTDSISGIEDIIKKYGETFNVNPETDYDVFVKIMRQFEDTVRINFNTEYQTLAESYTNHLKEFDKALKNATSGMGYEDAVALANQLGVTLTQFQQREGKFYLDDLNIIKNKLMPGQDGLKRVLQNRAKVIEQVFDDNGDIIPAWLEQQTEEALAAWPSELRQIYSAIQGFKNSGKDKTLEGWKEYIAQLQSNFNELDKATQYMIQSNWLATGNLDKFLSEIKDGDKVNKSQLYTKALKGELTGELAQFSQQIIELYQKNIKAVYDAVTNLISGQSISESVIVTDTNRALLEKILDKSLDDSQIGQVVQIPAEKAAENFDKTLYSLLGDQSYSWKARVEAAGKLWEGAFSSSNFRLDALKSAINSSFQDLDFATWGALPDSIRTLADYNTTTGKFFMSLNQAAQVINAQSLIDEGFTKQEANELIATLHKNTREKDIKTIASELVKNRESLTEENIASIATALGQTYDEVIATLQLQRNQDGTYRMNMNSILQLMNQKQGQLDTVLAQMIAEEIDNIIGNVSSIASNQGKGVTSYAEMQKAASRAQQAGFDVDISNLYEWNDTIHGFVLSAEGILVEVARARMEFESLSAENKEARQLLQEQIESMGRQLANSIDINAFMQAENKNPGSEAAKILTKGIDDYNSYLRAIGQTTLLDADKLIQNLRHGGQEAVSALTTVAKLQGRELNKQEIETAYRASVERLLTIEQELTAGAGEIISKDTAQKLQKHTQAKLKDLGNGSYLVLQAAENLTLAYLNLYSELARSGQATLAELNNTAAQYYNSREGAKKGQLLDMLSNSAEMTYNQLAEMFTAAGWKFTTDTIDQLGNNISKLNNGRVRINNFQGFANALGINTSSPEYLEAFKSYNDALIKESQFVEKTINDELNNLVKAKPGDLINISGLYTKLGDKLEEQLINTGVQFNNGIIKITEATKLHALIQKIEQAAASQELILESDVQALIDAVQALFKGLADSIAKGIQGTLSKTEAMDLQSSARNLLPGFNGELKFTQTYNGLKLSTDQAIKLYDAMKSVDTVSSHIVFDSLTKQLTKAGEACESMSRAVAEIARLEDKVKKSTGDARKEAEKQLAVYKQIANTQIQNPDSYDWMNRDLPDYLKGPENYWNSLGTAFKALNEAAKEAEEGSTKAAHMLDPTDFYNMVNEFNNIAQLSGTEINFLGHKLNGDMTSAAKLIEEGMRTLSNVDGDGVKVDLTKFGANFTGGAEGMAKGVHEGIKAMAESQIEMLDGMIQLLETVVAMEGLKDIAGTDNKIDLTDLFPEFTVEGQKHAANQNTRIFAAQILKQAETNEDLKKGLNGLIMDGQSIGQLLEQFANGTEFTQEQAQIATKKLEFFNKMLQSNDYSQENIITSIQQVFGSTGYKGTITLPNKQTYYIAQDYILEKGKNGWKVPGGGEYSDFNEALARFKLSEEQGITQSAAVYDAKNKTASAPLKVGTQTIQITSSIEGKNTYSIVGYPIDKKFTSRNQALWQAFKLEQAEQENKGAKFSGTTEERFKKWLVQSKVEIQSQIEVTNQQQLKTATHEQIVNLAQALVSGKEEDIEVAAGKIGIKYDVTGLGISQADFEKLATTGGIDTKTLALSLATEVVGDNAENVKKILAGQNLSATVDIEIGNDKTGLFSSSGGTATKQISEYKVTQAENFQVTGLDEIWAKLPKTKAQQLEALITKIAVDKDPQHWNPQQLKNDITSFLDGNVSQEDFISTHGYEAMALIDAIGAEKAVGAGFSTTGLANVITSIIDSTDTTQMLRRAKTLTVLINEVAGDNSSELDTNGLVTVIDNIWNDLDADPDFKWEATESLTMAITAINALPDGINKQDLINGIQNIWTENAPPEDKLKKTQILVMAFNLFARDNVGTSMKDTITTVIDTIFASNVDEKQLQDLETLLLVLDTLGIDDSKLDDAKREELNRNLETIKDKNIPADQKFQATKELIALITSISAGTDTNATNSLETDINNILGCNDSDELQKLVSNLIAKITKITATKANENVSPDLSGVLPEGPLDGGQREMNVTITKINPLTATTESVGGRLPQQLFEQSAWDKFWNGVVGRGKINLYTQGGLGADLHENLLMLMSDLINDQYKTIQPTEIPILFQLKNKGENLEMYDGTPVPEYINELLAVNQAKIDKQQFQNNLLLTFKELDPTNLQACATAMSELAESAQKVKDVPWQELVNGVNNINNIETPNEDLATASTIMRTIQASLSVVAAEGDTLAAEIISPNPIQHTIELLADVEDIQKKLQALKQFTINISSDAEPITEEQTSTTNVNTNNNQQTPEQKAREILTAIDQAINEAKNLFNELTSALSSLKETSTVTATGMQALDESIDSIPTTKDQAVSSLAMAMDNIPAVAYRIRDLNRQLDKLANKTININFDITFDTSSEAAEVKGNVDGQQMTKGVPTRISLAKGNAHAAGKTLVGELGPELVVSNGRYFLVGENGAQMVSLPNDAIVFNHLQTQNLLKKEHGGGRGKPVTNERNAVARAAGTGNAMASASSALAALKQIRAMWQSMLNASMKDLGALAGQEAGKASTSKSGGSSSDKDPEQQAKAVIEQIERWYNLLRQISKLQKDITYEENLQAKIESDRVANGKAMYTSYKQELNYLDEEIKKNQQLADLQKSWYERKREQLVNSDYGKIFTYDENGQLQYRHGTNLGLDVLEKLTRRDIYGATYGSAQDAATQINYLRGIGFDVDKLKYNDDGSRIEATDEEYADDPMQYYVDLMQNYWDRLDSWKDQLDSIYDSYTDQLNNVLTNETKRNQILQKIVDNQLSVEQDVLHAIESREQRLIDELQDERDALEKSNRDFLDGLSDQLSQEKQMYQNQENEKQLTKMRRQLAILERSGGSGSQIRSLQDQIAAKEQDQYFTAQQQQIAAIQKASDLQIDRMDSQIDLMTKTLEYQKEHGLLWEQVYQVMMATPQQIRQFITENTPDFQSASALDVAEKIRDIDLRINEWVGYRDDENSPDMTNAFYDWNSYAAARQEIYGSNASSDLIREAKAEFDKILNDTGDINRAGAVADAIFRAVLGDKPGVEEVAEVIADTVKEKQEDNNNDNDNNNNKNKNYYDYGNNYNYNRNNSQTMANKNTSTTDSKKTSWSFGSWQAQQDLQNLSNQIDTVSKSGAGSYAATESLKIAYRNMYDTYVKEGKLTDLAKKKYKYAGGGLVDYTGLAQVDGTPQRPEAFINAEQTQMLRNYLFGGSDSLLSLAQQIVQQMHGTSSGLNTNNITEQSGLNIEKIDVNVNVDRIANDYDVRQIGGKVMDEILAIARKSGTRGLSRR